MLVSRGMFDRASTARVPLSLAVVTLVVLLAVGLFLTAGDVARLTVEEGQIVVDVVKGHIAAPCRPAPSTDRGGFGARTNSGA